LSTKIFEVEPAAFVYQMQRISKDRFTEARRRVLIDRADGGVRRLPKKSSAQEPRLSTPRLGDPLNEPRADPQGLPERKLHRISTATSLAHHIVAIPPEINELRSRTDSTPAVSRKPLESPN
jgi:hypothetical protein